LASSFDAAANVLRDALKLHLNFVQYYPLFASKILYQIICILLNWCFTPGNDRWRKNKTLREISGPKRKEVTGDGRKLDNENLCVVT
jgi:hypothetical protein